MKNLQSLGNLSSISNVSSSGGINYLLKDNFVTTLAAGAINNTTAEPSGQIRTVADTNSVMSITGGVLSLATGGSAIGNPGLWYPSMDRIAGRVLLGTVVLSGTGNGAQFGFDTEQAGAMRTGISFATGGALRANRAAGGIVVGTFTASTYQLAVIAKATGAYVFIQGGSEFPNWTLVFIVDNDAGAIVPGIGVQNATISGFTADNLRIPRNLYLPTPLVYDTFTRADAALGNTETTGPDSQGIAALAWTDTLGTWAIATNKATCSATSGGSGFATINTSKADILIDAAVTRSAGVAGIVLRYADSTNYIIAYHDGTNAKLDKVIAGSTTNILTAAATYSAGATLRVIASGSIFFLYYNNVKIGATGTIADAAVQTTTVHGLYTTDTGNSLDTFLIFPRGTSSEYGTLDSF